MNLIEQSVRQIRKENLKNYYDTEQAEEELLDMLQSNRLYKIKDVTFGDIRCLAKELKPTEKNKKMLLNSYTPSLLSTETKQNSFVITYEDINKINGGYK